MKKTEAEMLKENLFYSPKHANYVCDEKEIAKVKYEIEQFNKQKLPYVRVSCTSILYQVETHLLLQLCFLYL